MELCIANVDGAVQAAAVLVPIAEENRITKTDLQTFFKQFEIGVTRFSIQLREPEVNADNEI